MKNKIICVVGPTASGKTTLAIEIAKAIDGEIVCADSMQVYQYFNIGTAKPTKEEILQVPHHLFDIIHPKEEFSVAKYVKLANDSIADIIKRGKMPIITGGTGLYIDALIRGTDFAKNDDQNLEIRQKYMDLALQNGNEYVHNLLKEIDLESYKKLYPNDLKRVIRALEVFEMTGETISSHNRKTKQIPSKYDALIFAIDAKDRQALYDRINLRVDLMLKQGLLLEAEHILNNAEIAKTAMGAIGYKELAPYFSGEASLEQAIAHLKQQTRRYAKRQLTWFRRNEQIHWLYDISNHLKMTKEALAIIKEQQYEKN